MGRHLVRRLASLGHDVVAVSRRPWPDAPQRVNLRIAEPRAREEFELLLKDVGTVIHLAASSTPGSTAGLPLLEMESNLRPTLALLEALQSASPTSLLYVSSAGTLYQPRAGIPSLEDSPLLPRSYHGAGKAAAEAFIHAWTSQCGASATVLRPSNVYGPGQSHKKGFGIIPAALAKLRDAEELIIWGDGNIVRDFLFIDDFVALCLAVLNAGMRQGMQVVNAARGEGTRLNDLLATMEGVTGRRLRRRYEPARSVDCARADIDPGLASRLFGWKARIGLEEGLQRTWHWMLSREAP